MSWTQVVTTLRSEFADLSDVEQLTRVGTRLLVAVLLGAAIGWQRERHGSAAGLRTHMLVALGAALFMLMPAQAGLDSGGMSRVLQGVVAGIGFLGASAVLKLGDRGKIRGLTTAAGIWTTAAIGAAVGYGREATALLATLIVLVILDAVARLERRVRPRQADRPKGPAPPPNRAGKSEEEG
jgi:putative Mg2+ transporter-C (MgtC) family protein